MALATITGTMLVPGVSRNNRLYSKDVIARTVERLQSRIADPEALPVVMRTHHAAGDNTRHIVGRITGVNVGENGHASYKASIYDTAAGRDLIAQVGGEDPAFRNVSIFGWWNGDVRQEQHNGQTVETGDDLEVDAIDFTAFPGVPGARIDSVRAESAPGESALAGRHLVTESISADVVAEAEMTGKAINDLDDSAFAYVEPGGKKDASGKTIPRSKRHFPIQDKAHVRNALARAPQSPFGDKAMPKIKAAAKKFGIKTSSDKKESAMPDRPLSEGLTDVKVSDVVECYGPGGEAGFSISAFNGPITVAINAYSGMQPSDLPAVAQAAMKAACDALCALDPDLDADIDVPGAPGADTDGDMGAGETSRDDDMESVRPEEPVNEHRPDPRKVAAAINRRHAEPASETTPETTSDEPANEREEKPVLDEAAITALIEAALDRRAQTTTAEPTAEATPKETAVNADTNQAADTAAPDTKTVEQATPARSLTDNDITALAGALGEAIKAALPQPAAEPDTTTSESKAVEPKAPEPATESAPAEKFDMKAVLQEAVKEAIPEILDAYGMPRRRGIRTTAEAKDEMSREQLWDNRADVLLGGYGLPQGQ
jgi:hypothetical protein